MTKDVNQHAAKAPKPGKKRGVLRWIIRSLFGFVAIASFAVAFGLWWLTDRPVDAPDWLRDRILARIEQTNPDMQVTFGRLQLTVRRGWRPAVRLRNLKVRSPDGGEAFALSELNASLAMRPLLDGLVQPKTVDMTGVFANLRREETGSVSFSASQTSLAAERTAASFAQLVGDLDDVFARDELSALREVNVNGITLRYEDARAKRGWTIDGARVRLSVENQTLRLSADLALLSGGAGVATMEANYDSVIGQDAANFGVTVSEIAASDIAGFSPAFGWLEGLRAPISGSLRGAIEGTNSLGLVNATLQIGPGALQPNAETRPIPFSSARTYFVFDPSTETLQFDELTVKSDWGEAQIEGRAKLSGLETGTLKELVGQFQLSGITVNPPDLYKGPLQFEGADVDLRLIPDPFRVDLGQLRIADQGKSMSLRGHLEAQQSGWALALDGAMPKIEYARLLELWPEAAASNTRNWLADNLFGGDLSNLSFAIRSKPGLKPDTFFSFDFDDAKVRFLPTMPPIEQGMGRASMLRHRFALMLDAGHVQAPQGGRIDVAGSSFVIPDVRVKGGTPAEVDLRTSSTATATLSLLDLEPLRIMTRAGLKPTIADGQAVAKTRLAFPIKRSTTTEEIEFDVAGTLRSVRSDSLVKGRSLRAPELRIRATNDVVDISGQGTFDGVPFDGAWTQVLGAQGDGSSIVKARIDLSQDSASRFNIDLPPGTLSGKASGNLVVTIPRSGVARFSVSSAMRGLGLSVPALGWRKGAASAGTLNVAGTLGSPARVDKLALKAAGLNLDGSVTLRANGGLARATLNRVQVGGWLDAPVTLIGRGAGQAPEIRVEGGTLDMRRAEFGSSDGSGSGNSDSGPLKIALRTLQITDSIALTDMEGSFTLQGGLNGAFSGRVNGQAPVTGQVQPSGARSAFRIKSQDAGSVFAAAGLLKQGRGGDMSLTLTPVGTAGAFNGALNITNTRVKDAPAIAALLNALSVVGLLEQMNGQGLHFAQVEAAFRMTPERVTLTQASATGPSIGISMDGTYDLNAERMDMQGVFSPLYLLNGIGSVLTRKGEGLVGFNFRLTGPSSSPKVQVNPLSALTPSIFREIFRRPPPTVEQEPGESAGQTPQVQRSEPRSTTGVASGAGER